MKGRAKEAGEDFSLGEHQFFLNDLIGKNVIDYNTNVLYGTVTDTDNRGAQDLLIIQTSDGEKMIPAIPQFIAQVSDAVYITPIPGLLNDDNT